MKIPNKITSKQLEVKLTQTKLYVNIKGVGVLIDAEWFKKIKVDDCEWLLESDGDKRNL